jgi:ribonucleoside-diphosphate reductase alpha chain
LINAPELLEDDLMNKDLSIIKAAIQSPKHSIFRNEDVILFLERVKLVHNEWINNGHRKGANFNNVSATISIKDDEWEKVGNWMWNNRESYNGLSVVPYDGGTYTQMPYEECTEQDYLDFCEKIKNINLNLKDVIEFDDKTDFSAEASCSGKDGCEIK